MAVLKNEKVSLRPIERADIVNLNQWKNDEAVYKFLGGGFLPVSINIHEKWLDSIMDTTGNNKRFIILDSQGKAIGMIGLYDINWIHRTCELGVFIGDRKEQGQGYASAAYLLIEQYAVRYLNLRKIKANVVANNNEALGMYKKLKFTQCGCLKDERFIDGEYCDLLIMEKLFLGGGTR